MIGSKSSSALRPLFGGRPSFSLIVLTTRSTSFLVSNLQGVSLASGVQEESACVSSRRRFLVGSAALLAGGAGAAVFPRVAQAHNTSNLPTDVDVLNPGARG